MSAIVLVWMLNYGRKDTPVLVANKNYNFTGNPFRNNAKALAVAAAMPIVAVPIQEVQLLDYAVAHETVNATYGQTASTDEDVYLGLLDKDPYTSDQQRERDEYEINDIDWNEVVFEEVNGGSSAKLALHNDWIYDKGYQVDGVVNLDLPEQGISGPFRITSIKHIIPQKKPVDDDESDEYDCRPVTALFTHESNQVYHISFDNGEQLGVTYQHPIYSTTLGDWKLAGELEIGEVVLTKSGNTKVVSSTKKEGLETVYNLEVKELHNFLVGESGIVVHNACFPLADVVSWAKTKTKTWGHHTWKIHGKESELIKRLDTKWNNPSSTISSKQGHWLDQDAAATFLESKQFDIAQIPGGETITFDVPSGWGEVLSYDAAKNLVRTPVTKIKVARGTVSKGSFIASAYPVL